MIAIMTKMMNSVIGKTDDNVSDLTQSLELMVIMSNVSYDVDDNEDNDHGNNDNWKDQNYD